VRCIECKEKFVPTVFLQKHCPKCKGAEKKYQSDKLSKSKKPKPIPKVSEKRKIDNIIYASERIKFLMMKENKICFIDGCLKEATTIEHSAGRLGFYDDWARDNNISLYIDKRFWKPCCLAHNLELENNSELSKKYQLSKITGKHKL